MPEFPDKLIYQKTAYLYNNKLETFIMFSTKKGNKNQAVMKCFADRINRDNKRDIPSLNIWKLASTNSGQGFGTALINFAKKFSKKIGCEGNIHLLADTSFSTGRVPHPFYIKMGMNCADKSINKKIQKFIAKNKNMMPKDVESVYMYYPPLNLK